MFKTVPTDAYDCHCIAMNKLGVGTLARPRCRTTRRDKKAQVLCLGLCDESGTALAMDDC